MDTTAPTLSKSQKRDQAAVTYKAMVKNLDAMGKTLLELMRHPQATDDQVKAARHAYLDCYQSWIAARIKLREAYPQTFRESMYRPLPWHSK